MDTIKKVWSSKITKVVLICLGLLVVILCSFQCGMFAGERRAQFGLAWGENYHKMFGGPENGWLRNQIPNRVMGPGPQDDFMNPNSVSGAIIKIDTSTITVKGFDNMEKSVLVNSDTVIMSGRNKVNSTSLKIDDQIVVLGSPSSTGQIEAKLIRLFNK